MVDYSTWPIERILPPHELHLIAGPSGGGKTTWLNQTLVEWSRGKAIFGYVSHPVPFAYVSCDRSNQGMWTTLERVGVPHDYPAIGGIENNLNSIDAVVDYVCRKLPEVRLIGVDGFGMLAPLGKSSGDYGAASSWAHHVIRLEQSRDLTIVGTMHSPKMRENEHYLDPRQRILGSVAWPAAAETIVIVERTREDDTESKLRRLTLLPRNAPEQCFDMMLDENGLLIPASPEQLDGTSAFIMARWIPKDSFTTSEAVEYGRSKNLSKRTVERWLQAAVDSNLIEQVGRGKYVPKVL